MRKVLEGDSRAGCGRVMREGGRARQLGTILRRRLRLPSIRYRALIRILLLYLYNLRTHAVIHLPHPLILILIFVPVLAGHPEAADQ